MKKSILALVSLLFVAPSLFADGIPQADYSYQCRNASENGDSTISIIKSARDEAYVMTVGNIGVSLKFAEFEKVLKMQLPVVANDNYTAALFTSNNGKLYVVATAKKMGFTQTLVNCELVLSPEMP